MTCRVHFFWRTLLNALREIVYIWSHNRWELWNPIRKADHTLPTLCGDCAVSETFWNQIACLRHCTVANQHRGKHLPRFSSAFCRLCCCCDGKSRAAYAQSFALCQQATIEFTCHDHSIIACSYTVLFAFLKATELLPSFPLHSLRQLWEFKRPKPSFAGFR